VDVAQARAFLRDNHRAVMHTRRSDGTPQLSPVVAGVDDDGRVLVSTRERSAKVRNLRRDPHASLCVFTDRFFGDWVQLDGTVEVVGRPEATELLVDYYRRLAGEHPHWDDYRAAMEREGRVLLRLTVERAGPSAQ